MKHGKQDPYALLRDFLHGLAHGSQRRVVILRFFKAIEAGNTSVLRNPDAAFQKSLAGADRNRIRDSINTVKLNT